MIHFEWLWALAFFPIPWLIRLLLPSAVQNEDAALRVPFLTEFNHIDVGKSSVTRNIWILIIAYIAWACLVIATARPQWLGDPIELPVSGRDLMMAVDLSGSMEYEDFVINGKAINRLVATKIVAGEFIERRVGDRLGLILFGKQAYLQTPLTFDRETVRTLLEESVIGLAGKETAIGDAIGLAVKRFRDSKKSAIQNQTSGDASNNENKNIDQILILLTDGANTAGAVEPLKAADLAASEGLKIYTIGIGADEMVVRSFFGGRRVNPSQDLDEETLTEIAETTGGKYFRARDIQELENIYKLLDEYEPAIQEKHSFRPTKALYTWPLSISVLLAILLLLRQSNVSQKHRGFGTANI